MNYLGVAGYREKAKIVTDTRERMMRAIQAMPGLRTFGDPLLGLFTYGAEDEEALPIFSVWGQLKQRGWFTGLITEPRGIHLMLSPSHAEAADSYLADLEEAVKKVREDGGAGGPTEVRYA